MTTLAILDATGITRFLSVTTNLSDSGFVGSHCTTDPLTGNKQTVNPQGQSFVTSDGIKATYRYVGSFTPGGSGDMIIIQGSATKTGRIKYIELGGLSTSGGNYLVSLLRRTSAATGGTSTAITPGKHDTTDPSATLAVTVYTVTPSSGTGNAGEGQRRIWLPSSTQQPFPTLWDFATRQDKAMILRGTSDFLCVFGNGALPAGGQIDFEIEIEEDNS